MAGGTSSRARTLPCTCTTQVTDSSTSSAGSTFGQPADRDRRLVAQPLPHLLGGVRRDQVSSTATASAASRHGRVGRTGTGVDRLAGGVDQLHHPRDDDVEAQRLDSCLGVVDRRVR